MNLGSLTLFDWHPSRWRHHIVLLAFLTALSAGLFVLDVVTPLGVAAGVPYVAVILMGGWLPWRHSILALSLICSALVVVGYFMSPMGSVLWMVITNRALALFAICVTAILLLQRHKAERALKGSYDNLEKLIAARTAELQLSERRMRDYSKAVSDWFWETDKDHRFSFFSDVDADKFPLATERTLGKTRWEIGDADIHDEKWRRHKANLDSHKPFRNFRYKALVGNDEYVWFNISGRPIFGGDGNFEGYRGTASNITEYVKLEERSQQHLKMEALGTLAGGIAHDLNNTLVPIIGMAELVKDDLPKISQNRSNLEVVLKAAAHARELVAQILAFSRQEKNAFNRVELAGELHSILHLLRSTIPSTINISEDINAVGDIYADHTKISQVVMNLISNAVYAMEEKGDLSIGLDLVEVDDKMMESHPQLEVGSYAQISIKDSGPGIIPSDINQIFDPFFTTKDVGQGTGLGLSVVYGIVLDHKGTITVSSNPGQGATFHVYLPMASDEAGPASLH